MANIQRVRNSLFRSSSSITGIRESVSKFSETLLDVNKIGVNTVKQTKKDNKFTRSLIASDDSFFRKRRESVRRKEREDVTEASGVGGAISYSGKLTTDSTRGFLGRMLNFFGILMVGWALKFLPTIIKGGKQLIKNIGNVINISKSFLGNIQKTVIDSNNALDKGQKKLKTFDFQDDVQKIGKEEEQLNQYFLGLDQNFGLIMNNIFDPIKNGLGRFEKYLTGGSKPPLKPNPKPKVSGVDKVTTENIKKPEVKKVKKDNTKDKIEKESKIKAQETKKAAEKEIERIKSNSNETVINKTVTTRRISRTSFSSEGLVRGGKVVSGNLTDDEAQDIQQEFRDARLSRLRLRKRFEDGYTPKKEIFYKDKNGKQRSKVNPEYIEYQEWLNESGFDMFADGGRPEVGKTSIVGEEGPELFVADAPGVIIPNDKLNSDSFFNRTTKTISGTSKDEIKQRRMDRSKYEKAVENLKEKQNGIIYHDQDEALKEQYIFAPRNARKNNTPSPSPKEIKPIIDGVESSDSVVVQKKSSVSEIIKKERVGPTVLVPMQMLSSSSPPPPPLPTDSIESGAPSSRVNIIKVLQDLELSYT